MKFTLKIDCENAAFKSEDGSADNMATEAEVARLLEEAAANIRDGRNEATVMDYNGNRVGEWKFGPGRVRL